jgi:predicted transcriptional regulator
MMQNIYNMEFKQTAYMILQECSGKTLTRLNYDLCLSFPTLSLYLKDMQKNDLIMKSENNLYFRTEKGIEYLKKFRKKFAFP